MVEREPSEISTLLGLTRSDHLAVWNFTCGIRGSVIESDGIFKDGWNMHYLNISSQRSVREFKAYMHLAAHRFFGADLTRREDGRTEPQPIIGLARGL